MRLHFCNLDENKFLCLGQQKVQQKVYFLAISLDEIPIGVAYSIWSGVGIVGIAFLSMVVYGQKPDLGGMIGMGLIIVGIIVMRLYSDMAVE